MPKVALAELMAEWHQLLAAAEPYVEVKDFKKELAMLRTAYEQLRELNALRESLQARHQKATQEMGVVKVEGKDAAIRVRAMLKGILGSHNERLVEFKVTPIRPRRRRSTRTKTASPGTSSSK